MTLHLHRRRDRTRTVEARVWLNGHDVTGRTLRLDTRRRRVYLLDTTPTGRPVFDPVAMDLLGRWHFGHVRVRLHSRVINLRATRIPYPGEDRTSRRVGPLTWCCAQGFKP